MQLHTISQSIAKGSERQAPGKKIIGSTVIPVEVFVIFLMDMHRSFTITDLINVFYARHEIELRFERMQQICTDLVLADKVKRHQATSKKNHKATNFYTFNTIL